MASYNPKLIEKKIQKYWEDKQSFKAENNIKKDKYYVLAMFPYPSGKIHIGHVRNYVITDVLARYQRMLGKNVLHPMGWDAFGLPAENAAIKHGKSPNTWTKENITIMKQQFKQLGLSFDWSREITTCDANYYKWEQQLFIELFDRGLAYQKEAIVNWDPLDKTVLANEQVIDGKGWRSGADIERKKMLQWFIKITDYADRLLEDLSTLDGWSNKIKLMQSNWIDRSTGLEIDFMLQDNKTKLTVYTTRADTLMGVSYLVISPEHDLIKKLVNNNPTINHFIKECKKLKVAEAELQTVEKQGIDSNLKAIHPINGQIIPIWIANFVVADYGSGVVMSVPAHDQRDYEFATKYNLTIKQVIEPLNKEKINLTEKAFTEYGKLINSGQFTNLTSEQAQEKITDFLTKTKQSRKKINYRLRDWGVSRQRYWGAPIPIIYCDDCGTIPVAKQDLPVKLPTNIEFTADFSLAKCEKFIKTKCPKCNKTARRETNTFDTFFESSWYFLKYTCLNNQTMLDDQAKYWLPVDQYVGGIEHAILHLLYARFFNKLIADIRPEFKLPKEPFKKLLTQGMVLKDGSKMSKSKGNIVDPTNLIENYGADTVRLFTMFTAPPEQSLEYSDSGVEGSYRYLKKLWNLINNFINNKTIKNLTIDENNLTPEEQKLWHQINKTIVKVKDDYAKRYTFNTAIAALMSLTNDLTGFVKNHTYDNVVVYQGLRILILLLYPIVPHISTELFTILVDKNIDQAKFPTASEKALKQNKIDMIIQINGKLRAKISVATDLTDKTIKNIALAQENVLKFTKNKKIVKIIIVKNKLVNFVVK